MLPLSPSAQERVKLIREIVWQLDAAQEINNAHRDGFTAGAQAERAAIIAMLREPSEGLIDLTARSICKDDHFGEDVWDKIAEDEGDYDRRRREIEWETMSVGTRSDYRSHALAALRALADHLSQLQNSDDN